MQESTKTKEILGESFLEEYIYNKKVLDIGCGDDPVTQAAEKFDLEDGDANYIDRYLQKNTYDTVYASHCLEHMHNPYNCLERWFSLVKKNGHMIIIIPDGDLYEQNQFPSLFNSDHKHIFFDQLKKEKDKHIDVINLFKSLQNGNVILYELQDNHYNYNLKFTKKKPSFLLHHRIQKFLLKRIHIKLFYKILLYLHALGIPIDQTLGKASAQRLIVIKKE